MFAGIYDVLALLRSRQVKLAVVSGKSRRAVEVTLKQAGITGHFDAVTAGSANGDLKRHNIQVIINAWGFDPRTIAFVGDTDADIDAANAAGVIAVGAAWSDNAKAGALEITGADVVFSEVATFHSWLKLGTHRHLGKA